MSDRPEKDERTEEATPHRREEARGRGQVAFSSELVAALMLVAAAGSFAVGGGELAAAGGDLVVDGLGGLGAGASSDLHGVEVVGRVVDATKRIVPAALLVLAPMMLVGLLVGFGQVGVRFAPKAVELNFEKLNPVAGLKKVFGVRGWVRTGLGALKICLVVAAVAAVAWSHVPELTAVAGAELRPVIVALSTVLFRGVAAGVAVIVALALIDFFFQRFQHSRDIRMTRKEMKDEAKNTDGDPLVKSRIRQLQRELASRRMMSDVPDATVIVTNPTHVAVALRYEDGDDAAPRIVAKGLDLVAQRIKEVARDAGVIVYEEAPLARALHRDCEIGDYVPEDLFEAVARILAYVFRVEGRAVPVGAE